MQFSLHPRGSALMPPLLFWTPPRGTQNHEKSYWGLYGAHFGPFSQQTFAESTPKMLTFTPKAAKKHFEIGRIRLK